MATIKQTVFIILLLVFSNAIINDTFARTNLVSLPSRQQVDIRLGLSEPGKNATLVQEKRKLSLKKGINKIDFSWQNVMIDPASIILQTLSNPDTIRIISVSYPPNEAALTWDIYSDRDVEEEVMISYLLANIDGLSDYRALADSKEKTLDITTYLVLRNFSGENFEGADVYSQFGNPILTRINHLETKKIQVSKLEDVEIQKIYTWDELKMPHEPEKLNQSVGIPTSYEINIPLFNGKFRIFQDDNNESTVFTGEDQVSFTPKGDKARIYIGDSRDIVVSQYRLSTKRSNIKRNTKGAIQVYDEIIKEKIRIENFKKNSATLSLVQNIEGQWEPISISEEYQLKDHKTLVFEIELQPKEKKTVHLHYTIKNIFSHKFSRYNRLYE